MTAGRNDEILTRWNLEKILTNRVRGIDSNPPNKVFSRSDLIEKVKGIEFDGLDRSIDSHIKNLRHKIENDAKSPMYILTVHGTGYRFGGH